MDAWARKQRPGSMTTKTIISNNNHPLFSQLSGLEDYSFISYEDIYENIPTEGIIFDCTLLEDSEKEKLFSHLGHLEIISDLSCNWGDYFVEKFPHLNSAMALSFWAPTDKREVWLRGDDSHVTPFLNLLGLKAKTVSRPGIGFTYPRTISLLINEAFLAEEDQLATQESMDTAMKFGVNYPLGLFEWAQKIGARPLVNLLTTLSTVTEKSRYRCSTALKKKAFLER